MKKTALAALLASAVAFAPWQAVEAADVGGGVGEAIDEFGQIEATAEAVEIVMERCKRILGFGLGDDVQIATARDQKANLGERFEVPGKLAAWTSQPFRDGLDAAELGGEEDADLVGLGEAALALLRG